MIMMMMKIFASLICLPAKLVDNLSQHRVNAVSIVCLCNKTKIIWCRAGYCEIKKYNHISYSEWRWMRWVCAIAVNMSNNSTPKWWQLSTELVLRLHFCKYCKLSHRRKTCVTLLNLLICDAWPGCDYVTTMKTLSFIHAFSHTLKQAYSVFCCWYQRQCLNWWIMIVMVHHRPL